MKSAAACIRVSLRPCRPIACHSPWHQRQRPAIVPSLRSASSNSGSSSNKNNNNQGSASDGIVVPSSLKPAETPRSSPPARPEVLNSAWLREVLDQNVRWATDVARTRPDLLPALSQGQQPKILWIGCADSRVPETTILGLQPGDVFVHRNIANVVNPTDLSALSVIEYAVRYLKVQHIVLCGHTSCGGVAAALGNKSLGKIDTWLMPLRQLRLEQKERLDACSSEAERGKLLVEANVRKGVQVLRMLPEVIDAVAEGRLDITGVVYDLSLGQLKPLEEEEGAKHDDAVKYAFGLGEI